MVTVQGETLLLGSHSTGHSLSTRLFVDNGSEMCGPAKSTRNLLVGGAIADVIMLVALHLTGTRRFRVALGIGILLVSILSLIALLSGTRPAPALALSLVALPAIWAVWKGSRDNPPDVPRTALESRSTASESER